MDSDGSYMQRQPRTAEEEIGSQQRLAEKALSRAKTKVRYRKGKTRRRIVGRNLR